MKNYFKLHFPSNLEKWNLYTKKVVPILFASFFFAFNGMVDNFMVGHINQGQAALGAVNSWTGIFFGFLLAISGVGAILNSQFYSSKNFKLVKEVSRYRMFLILLGFAILAFFTLIFPNTLISVFARNQDDDIIFQNARIYARISILTWFLSGVVGTYGRTIREMGFTKLPFIWNIFSLLTNIFFNSIFMYGLNFGVAGAAWASVISRSVALIFAVVFIWVHKLPIETNPLNLFKFSKKIQKIFWKRWIYFFALFSIILFVTLRNVFYAYTYPIGTLGVGVGGLAVFSLVGAIVNVFMTSFNSISIMSSIFVGQEFGKGNMEQARINSDELKGFNLVVSLIFSFIAITFALFIPQMHFLSRDQFSESGKLIFDSKAQLRQVSHCIMIMCFFYPIWTWFNTSYRNAQSGGKGQIFSLVNWIFTGPLQLGFLAILTFFVVHHFSYLSTHFWLLYFIFFLSDVVKSFFIEFLYYRVDWKHSIVSQEL